MIVLGVPVWAAALAVLLKEKIENFAATGIVIMAAIVLFFAKLGIADVGVVAVVVLTTLSLIYLVIYFFKDKARVTSNVMTTGGFVICFTVAVLMLLNMGRAAVDTGGYAINYPKKFYYYKDMARAFANSPHPQLLSMWEFLAEATWLKWSDGICIWAKDVLMVSMLFPLFSLIDTIKSKVMTSLNASFMLLTVFVIPLLCSKGEYESVTLDTIMSIALGMSVVMFARGIIEKNYSYLYVVNSFFVVAMLTKRIGIVFVAIFFVWMSYELMKEKQVVKAIVFCLVPMTAYVLLFKFDLYVIAAVMAFAFGAAMFILLDKWDVLGRIGFKFQYFTWILVAVFFVAAQRFLSDSTDYNRLMVRDFIRVIFTTDKFFVGREIKISVAFFLILVSVAAYIFFRRSKDKNTAAVGRIFWYCVGSSVLYLLVLLFLYIRDIARVNLRLLSTPDTYTAFERYAIPVAMIMVCYGIYTYMQLSEKDYSIILITAVLGLTANTDGLFSFALEKKPQPRFYGFENCGIELSWDDSILYIDEEQEAPSDDFEFYFLPTKAASLKELTYSYLYEEENEQLSVAELSEKFEDYDYIYIQHVNEEFYENYGSLFEEGNNIVDGGAVYRYDAGAGKLVFIGR